MPIATLPPAHLLRKPASTSLILFERYQIEMIGIHACSIATQVIELQLLRDRSDK